MLLLTALRLADFGQTILTGKQVQNEVKCSAFDVEMIFILVQIKLIFTKKVVHLASF